MIKKKKHTVTIKNKITGKEKDIDPKRLPDFNDEWKIHTYDRTKENIEYLRKHGLIND